MGVSGHGLVGLFLFLLLPSFSMQQNIDPVGDVYLDCLRNSTTSTLNSTFTRNLNTTLANFTTLSLQGSKYAITPVQAESSSAGQDNTVYAVFQCRGDLSEASCAACVQNASARLPQACPEAVGARIRLEACFLRYDIQSFFVLDATFVTGFCNTVNTNDSAALEAFAGIMAFVTNEAPKQAGRFASRSLSGMHAAAQCLGYLNESDCSACLLNTSYRLCDYSFGVRIFMASCDYRYEAYNFLEAPAPSSLIGPVPAPSTLVDTPHSPAGSKTPIIIGVSVVVGVIVVVGALCAILVWRHKATKIKGVKVDKTTSWPRQLLQNKAQVFSLEELEEATAHFHPTNTLGEGGFGIVYKGTLSDGELVAIKKLSIGSQQGKQEFLNEVNLITSVQHKNLIRLLGCCVEGLERILVYEYLPNRSLDFFLFGEEARANRMLNWSTRYGIVVGMAKGLAYLHEESHIRIIHRDIKPSNILLDDQLNPVIADFGLARLVKDNATHVNTGVAGTIGYLAPEYALHGALSEKVDVFSFGLVSLEVITGKKNVHSMLLTWVWENYQHEKVLDLVDERLGNAFSPEQVIHVLHVALLCTQENPKQRPTMSMVTLWLSRVSDILEIPIRPRFLDYNDSTASTGEFNHQFTSTSSTSQSTGGRVSGGLQSLSEIIDPR